MGYEEAIWSRCHTEWGQSKGEGRVLLPSCHLCSSFHFAGDLGTSVGLGEPTRIWEKDRSALASPNIILTRGTSEALSTAPHCSSSCGLMNTLQQKLAGFCPVASAAADGNQPSLELTFLPLPRCVPRCSDKRVHRMAAVMVVWWVLAISSWIGDRWLCWLWQAVNFPYFHSFW